MNCRGRRGSRPALKYLGSGLVAIERDPTPRVERLVLAEARRGPRRRLAGCPRVSPIGLNTRRQWDTRWTTHRPGWAASASAWMCHLSGDISLDAPAKGSC